MNILLKYPQNIIKNKSNHKLIKFTQEKSISPLNHYNNHNKNHKVSLNFNQSKILN